MESGGDPKQPINMWMFSTLSVKLEKKTGLTRVCASASPSLHCARTDCWESGPLVGPRRDPTRDKSATHLRFGQMSTKIARTRRHLNSCSIINILV